jgi:hypothetical protein
VSQSRGAPHPSSFIFHPSSFSASITAS